VADERGYFKPGGPANPLRVEGGRVITDSNDVMWLAGSYVRDDYTPSEGVLKGGVGAANCDNFVDELVDRFNAYPMLVELVRTAIRETSAPAAHAFIRDVDLPRVHYHLRTQLKALGIDANITGGPAVLEIPPMPEDFAEHPDETEDHWQAAWLAGYQAAWREPSGPRNTTSTAEKRETER
jgi:hypothetical protein